MKDTKYPYRCKAFGISSWIPISKPVNPDYKFQLCMSRPAKCKYSGVGFPGFAQPGIPRFGEIYRVEKNPYYIAPVLCRDAKGKTFVMPEVSPYRCLGAPRKKGRHVAREEDFIKPPTTVWDRAARIRAKQLKAKKS